MNAMFHIDQTARKRFEEQIRMFGIRPVLDALVHLCEGRAEVCVELYNTVQAKQWAAWAVALEALRDNRKLTDPRRE